MTTDTTKSGPTSARRIAGWTLEKVADAAGGRLQGDAAKGRAALTPSRVCSDTRALRGGELFVALRGENFDAHDFLDQAEQKGAIAAMVDRGDVDCELPLIVVDDTLAGLTRLGQAVWQEATAEGLHTIDVTGSNGKTTVKEMLALLWGARGDVFATPGNLNNHIGVPLVLCDLPERCEHLVVEMGANAPEEISQLVGLAPGSERIITSIGVAHIEGFGSVDGIRQAKSEIFEQADDETLAIVPFAEVDHLIGDDFEGRVLTVGTEAGADVRVRSIEAQADQTSQPNAAQLVELTYGGRTLRLCLPIPGPHHALNVGTALATLLGRGAELDQELCNTALSTLALPKGRWRVVEAGEVSFIDDAYNANPSSVKASFEAFMGTDDPQKRPRVAVIGEMLELGGGADKWHRDVAAALAGHSDLDAFVAVGPYAEQMAEAARANAVAKLESVGFETVEEAADWLAARGPSFVLLKASRGARLERLVDLTRAKGENLRAEKT